MTSRESSIALWLARIATARLPRDEREFARGDLIEEFEQRVADASSFAAHRWLARQALACLLWRAAPERDVYAATHCRESTIAGVVRDGTYALRQLRRTPLVSTAAVLTFALGIGANAAIFSVAWPVLGRALVFPDESALAFILLSIERERGGAGPNPISPGDYVDLMRARSFERLAGFNMFTSQRNLQAPAGPAQVRVGTVTEDFFGVMAVPALAGRPLDARDFREGARALLLRERTWRRHFNADPDVVHRMVRMDDADWAIVGVMPDEAAVGTVDVDAWTTQRIDPATARQQRSYFLAMVGRLRPGLTLDLANAELGGIMRAAAERYPASNRLPNGAPVLARAESFRERLTGPVRPALLLLIGGAVLVLVIAATNLAGLQLARNLARRMELDVRRALGAGRGRLVRQLTVEGLALAAMGGGAGLLAASLTLGALARIAPTVAWYEVSSRLTAPVVLFTGAVTLLAGLAIGLAPAIAASRPVRDDALRVRGGTAARAAVRSRLLIISAQVAMTVLLLIGASLTGASLVRVLRIERGFEIDRGLIADVKPALDQGPAIRFFDDLTTRAAALPGVSRACAINNVPLDNEGGWMTFIVEGGRDDDMISALPMGVTEGCFDTLRIPLVRGRLFHSRESESVVILNESMARALFSDVADPVGRRVHLGLVSGPLFTVVGVVRDIRASALESRNTRQVWFSASRGWPMPQRLILRSETPPESLARPLRTLLADLAPGLALANIRTMDDIVTKATASRRFVLVLLGGFAAIALALSAVGIYGTLAHQVGQRRREIGIRVALGARRLHVVRAIVGPTLAGIAAGLAIGLLGGRRLATLITAQLYAQSPSDPRILTGVSIFVLVVAVAACWPAVRRALRLDPVAALKAD